MNGTYQGNTQRKRCKELRAQALDSLRGKWMIAILAMIIATILGAQLATTGGNATISFNTSSSGVNVELPLDTEDVEPGTLPDYEEILPSREELEEILPILIPTLGLVLMGFAFGLVISLAFSIFVGTPMRIGHLRFRLSLLDGEKGDLAKIFSGFDRSYLRAIGLRLLKAVYLFLWGLPCGLMAAIAGTAAVLGVMDSAFSIAGLEFLGATLYIVAAVALVFAVGFSFLQVIAVYRYAMSDYILAENPDMLVSDAIRESARMMRGNKWRLFCLELSFIGWGFLCLFTCGIGYLWLNPYMYQAEAALYHEISGREAIHEAVADMKELMEQL